MAATDYIKIFRDHNGILRAAAAIRLGMPKYILYKMVTAGELVREAPGLYRLSETGPLDDPDLVQISLRVPRAVICLFSALSYHGLTTQVPHAIHIALPQGIKTPRIKYPPLRVFHLSPESYRTGILTQEMDGVPVRFYNREKTVADCFKFREKVGMDVTLEALKDYLRQPHPDVSLLLEYARVNRVQKVMWPYLEALV